MLRLMVVIGCCLATCSAKNSYFITAPNTIIKGEEFSVSVQILNATRPVQVKAQIVEVVTNGTKQTRKVWNGQKKQFKMGVPGVLKLKLNQKAVLPSQYKLKIRARHGIECEQEKSLIVHNQKIKSLIQTDKAMYKGGQTVNFRVVTILGDLKPFKGEIDIMLMDDKNNVMKKWKKRQHKTGVITESYQLTDDPRSGVWIIKATIPSLDGYSSQQSFLVQHYVLPKFEVKVELSPFGLYSDLEIRGTVKATYTFGKPVEGMVDLRAFTGNIRNHCGKEMKSVIQVLQIEDDGEVSFVFSVSDLKKSGSIYSNLHTVQIVARVTETVTGAVLNGTGEIKFYTSPYKLQFLPVTASTFKPGLPYVAYAKLTTQDDVPVTDQREDIKVYTCVDFTRQEADQNKYACSQFQGTYALATKSLKPDKHGIAKIDIGEVPRNSTKIKIKAWYRNVNVQYYVNSAYSPSNNFIQVSTHVFGDQTKVDETVNFQIRSTEPVASVQYVIKARGIIEEIREHNMGNSQFSTMALPVTSDMAPSAHILVYYMRKGGEVVADAVTFSVDRLFKHKVSVKYNKDKASPDESVDLVVSAEPDSIVFVLGVDQSVLLLKSGNDLTQDKEGETAALFKNRMKARGLFQLGSPKVKSAMESFSNVPNPITLPRWHFGRQSSADRATRYFKDAGVLVISDIDAFATTRRYNKYSGSSNRQYSSPRGYGGGGAYGSPGMRMPEPVGISYDSEMSFAPESGGNLVEPDRVRSVFPETWFWDNKTVRADGKVEFTAKAPDTITSWVASAFGVHGLVGLGVAADTDKLLVEKAFFVSLNLPSSVKYGEVVTIQAIIFNYLNQDVPVTVTFPSSSKYTNIAITSNGDEADTTEDQSTTVMVPSGTPTSVYFPIRPKYRGLIDITVTAKSYIASDAVKRQLLVKPEGIRREKNVNIMVKTTSGGQFKRELLLENPNGLVPDTMKVKLAASGDFMGLTVDNLQNYIRLPTGCGEQSLMKFTPNIFVADYLSTTDQFDPYISRKIHQYLELGYQKQLTYQRWDRSYSPFGDSDGSGSVWLTSFVVRSFEQAEKYIFIDNKKTAESVRWILDRQTLDGSFVESGTIIDRHLQKMPVCLTAYVLLSLLEVDANILITPNYNVGRGYSTNSRPLQMVNFYKFGNVTHNATRYLEKSIQTAECSYSLAITALALTKAGSPYADAAFSKITSRLITRDDTKYIQVDQKKDEKQTWAVQPVTTYDIIATSYVLMTYIERDEVGSGQDLVKFLLNQRNRHGGFKSSQDTIVALEALSRYAAASRPADFELDIQVTSDQGDFVKFNIKQSNALVLSLEELKGPIATLTIDAQGSGVAYLDVSTEYYVTGDDVNDNFDISTVLLDDNLNGFTLMTCSKVLKGPPTGMAIGSIQIPAGFDPDTSDINVVGVRRVEKSGNNVNIYYDQIGKTSTCVSLKAYRSNMVSNSQESYVDFVDYYQPDKRTTVTYAPISLKESTVCHVCPNCNNCRPS